jgi:hypothetical protein
VNHHELIDSGTIAISSLMLRKSKFFARSIDSPPVGTVIEGTAVPDLGSDSVRQSSIQDVSIETTIGSYDAAYLPWRWVGPDKPTVIYHHGSGESPFDFGRFRSNSFHRLFGSQRVMQDVNLVGIRAPFHDRSSLAYAKSMGELADFVGMLASSTALIEALCQQFRRRGAPVFVSGISLGGWITNLHRTWHNSADR